MAVEKQGKASKVGRISSGGVLRAGERACGFVFQLVSVELAKGLGEMDHSIGMHETYCVQSTHPLQIWQQFDSS